MSASLSQQICPICKLKCEDDDGEVVQIRQKGADSINSASAKRLDSITDVTAGCKVHSSCRKRYTRSRDIDNNLKRKKSGETIASARSSRISEGLFHSKTDCFFCGASVLEGSAGYRYTSKLITLHKQYFNAARIDVTSGLLKSKVKLNTIMVTYMQQTAYITIPVAAISVVVVMYPCSFRPAPSQNGGNLEGQGIRTKMKLFQRCVHIWKEMTKSS